MQWELAYVEKQEDIKIMESFRKHVSGMSKCDPARGVSEIRNGEDFPAGN